MLEFIKRHYRIILPLLVIVVVLIIAFAFRAKENPNQSNQSGEFLSDYKFLKSNISKDDKYLMVLGKNTVEDFGTYSSSDPRGLLDLYNQSTAEFSAKVQRLIDSTSEKTDMETVVDPDSIKLKKISDTEYRVSMEASTTDNVTKKTTDNTYTVVLVKVYDYWLVNDIITEK